jgi:hypothetical protein
MFRKTNQNVPKVALDILDLKLNIKEGLTKVSYVKEFGRNFFSQTAKFRQIWSPCLGHTLPVGGTHRKANMSNVVTMES